MHKIESDRQKNILFITLAGFVKDDEADGIIKQVLIESTKLQPGFTIVNNIADFKPTSQDTATKLQQAQADLFKKGAKRAIRIVGDAFLSNMQFNRTKKDANAGYELITVKTPDDALAELKKLNLL